MFFFAVHMVVVLWLVMTDVLFKIDSELNVTEGQTIELELKATTFVDLEL